MKFKTDDIHGVHTVCKFFTDFISRFFKNVAGAEIPPCRFEEHSLCIAPNFMTFNYTKCTDCPRECLKHTYVRNVEYGKYHEPIYRTLKKFSLTTGSQGIDIAAFQVNYDMI